MMRALIGTFGALVALSLGLGWSGPVCAQGDAKPSVGAESKQVAVVLRADAVVDEAVVTIGAVANIQGGELWLRQMIGSLDIAEVSRVGKSVAVSRDQVALRIQLAGVDLQKFRVEGPAQVMVKLNAIELTEQEIVKAAQQAVIQKLKMNAKDVDFRLLEKVILPAVNVAANDQLQFEADPQSAGVTAGKTRVNVGVFVNGQRRGVATVIMEIARYREVAVANRRIEAGETLLAVHVRSERRPLAGSEHILAYADQLLGKSLLHTIEAGQALTRGDLDLPPGEDEVLIHPRDNVKLVALVGNLRVTVVGEAQQEGKIGQMIRVRNTDSGKVITGRVLDRSTVEVEY